MTHSAIPHPAESADMVQIVARAMGETLIPGSTTIPASMVMSPELIARMARATIAAYEAALAASGYVIVPRVPTEAMILRGAISRYGDIGPDEWDEVSDDDKGLCRLFAKHCWARMLYAALAQSAPPAEPLSADKSGRVG